MAVLDFVAAYNALVGGLYAYIGLHMGQRRVEGPGRVALALFQVFWFALGLVSLMAAIQVVLFRLGWLPIPLYMAMGQFNLFLIVAALWGILYYLWYLYTGSTSALGPLTVVYVLFYAALSAWVMSFGQPERIVDGGWALETRPEIEVHPGVGIALLLGLIGPQVAAAFAYLRLYFLAETPTQKYRIGLVSGSILVWFGLSLIASLIAAATGVEFTTTDGWQVASRVISLAAVLAILAAYRPPQWVQRRFHVEAV